MKTFLIILIGLWGMNSSKEHYAACTTFKCIEGHKNQSGQVVGTLRAYTPNKSGKGAGYMFWDYEILLSDSVAIPVIEKPGHHLEFKAFLGKTIKMKCTFYYGVVIGGGHPDAQAATGWRIDAENISEIK